MISVLIPLHRSKRWLPVIERNIEQALSIGAEVVLSDRHGIDDALDCLRRRFGGAPGMIFLEEHDGGDFVENTNALIRVSTREYFRIVPHDDDASARGTLGLVDGLCADPHAVLAYGGVEGMDENGNRRPEIDTLHEHEPAVPERWSLSEVLPIFWTGRFNGAFKALIRKSAIDQNELLIRKRGTAWFCERAWLFGLGLVGRFCRAPGVMLQKRYYPESTHRQWRRTPQVIHSAAEVLASYARDLIADVNRAGFAGGSEP